MFFSRPAGHKLVNRGDFTPNDFTLVDFTIGGWQTLDLSSIVPKGAVGVLLFCSFVSDNIDTQIYFREKGIVLDRNMVIFSLCSVERGFSRQSIVFCDKDAQVEYNAFSSGVFISINVNVNGWFA